MVRKSFKISLGGIVSALALSLMFFTGITPFGTFAFPMFAGILIVIVSIESGSKYAFLTYGVVGILSLFITPDRESALLFIAFLGYYPIIKKYLEKIKNRIIEYTLKFLIFNISVLVAYSIAIFVFNMKEIIDEYNLGNWFFVISAVLLNVFFIIYDKTATKLITAYVYWFKPKFLSKFGQ